jgi:hypothetical protein
MLNLGIDVIRHESLSYAGEDGAYHDYDPIDWFKEYCQNRIPVIIMRDPIRRVVSLYHYKKHHQKGDVYEIHENSLREALENRPYMYNQSNYDKYIGMWSPYSPMLVYLEDLVQLNGFPHVNKCGCEKNYDENIVKEFIDFKIHSRYE